MVGNLNEKYHNIFVTNTVLKAATLCTNYMLQFVLLPQMTQERKLSFR